MAIRVADHKNPGLLNSDFDKTSRSFSVTDLLKYCAVAECCKAREIINCVLGKIRKILLDKKVTCNA